MRGYRFGKRFSRFKSNVPSRTKKAVHKLQGKGAARMPGKHHKRK